MSWQSEKLESIRERNTKIFHLVSAASPIHFQFEKKNHNFFLKMSDCEDDPFACDMEVDDDDPFACDDEVDDVEDPYDDPFADGADPFAGDGEDDEGTTKEEEEEEDNIVEMFNNYCKIQGGVSEAIRRKIDDVKERFDVPSRMALAYLYVECWRECHL